MRALNLPHAGVSLRRQVRDPQVTVSLVAAACVLVEAVIAKNVIDVELDFFSQFAPLWIFIAYLVSGLRDRASEIAFVAVIILATAAVLVLYAIREPPEKKLSDATPTRDPWTPSGPRSSIRAGSSHRRASDEKPGTFT